MTKRSILKRDLKAIKECLDAGIPLEMEGREGKRRFTKGQIVTDDVRGKLVRTTHLSANLDTYVWLNGFGTAALGEQARAKLARKDEILAEQKQASEAFYLR